MTISPPVFLREAVKAFPPAKYAMGVGTLGAVLALVAGWGIDPLVAIFGGLIIVIFMVLLLIFSSLLGRKQPNPLRPLALTLAWFCLFLSMGCSFLVASSFFFYWPQDIHVYFPPKDAVTVTVEGIVLDNAGHTISDATITVGGYQVSMRSREDGKFAGQLEHARMNEMVTVRAYHPAFKSFAVDRKIEKITEDFRFELQRR